MAARPIWRGHLRLALVSCPVALYTAQRDAGNLHFHLINPATGNRIQMVTQDSETHDELSRRDLVRGYEFEKDRYLIVEDADFESARIESSSVMVIGKFIAADSIDPVYFDGSYHCAPDGDAGLDVFAVLQAAIRDSGRVALSRVVMSRREHAVAIMPMGRGLVAHVLHEERDIVNPESLFTDLPETSPDPEMVRLAQDLIERQAGKLEPADLEDRYESKLRAVIEAKLHGAGVEPAVEPAGADNVIDLLSALRRSLGQATPAPTKAQNKPAPKKAARPARKRA